MPDCITTDKVNSLQKLLAQSRRAAIAVHTHPDGDALGSGIAAMEYLKAEWGMSARLIVPTTPPDSMNFLTEGEDITDASVDMEAAAAIIKDCDLLLVLDMNAFNRADELEPLLQACKAQKLLIDHHLNPDLPAFDLAFSQNDISSACEMLYYVLKSLGKPIPPKAATALMTGMTTDTNNFANSVYPSTLQMASELLEAGVDRSYILEKLYQSERRERLAAFADLLGRHLKIMPNGIAYIIMTSEMFEAYGIKDGETEGLVNIPLQIEEVKISIFLREEGGLYRASIRAKKGWSANKIAVEYFHGGGHELASGGKLRYPDDIPDKNAAEQYLRGISAR